MELDSHVGALYGFQRPVGPNVSPLDRWIPGVGMVSKWSYLEELAAPLIDAGIYHHHLHNPFALHARVGGDLEHTMHVDQYELASQHAELDWLTDLRQFSRAIEWVRQRTWSVLNRDAVVTAYVGSPVYVPHSLIRGPMWAPPTSADGQTFWRGVIVRRSLGLCWFRRCSCWNDLMSFYLKPLLDSGVDAIGFDQSADYRMHPCVPPYIAKLSDKILVLLEAWPYRDYAPYPEAVRWIINERTYQQRRAGTPPQLVPFTEARPQFGDDPSIPAIMRGRVQRIIKKNEHDHPEEVVAEVLADGDIALLSQSHLREILEGNANRFPWA